jgi:exonuclease SbcC
MKILGLRFANLNSLEGEWEVDFTAPEYLADGIFAITGPTGSGKSTILDALCLALYGQTPRLGRITRSANEIMSRHAGSCFAEATFETPKGRFRSHWSQHRARKKAGGELQTQKHELSDVGSGVPIQTKLQETLAAVEELTGMDFDRFTRSMLLAQGGFAAFLQADPDRRAPVLEQITGTEVYSLISMRVHERHRTERAKLDLLRTETESLRLLDAEVVDSLQSRLGELIESESLARVELEAATDALRRIDLIATLERDLAGIGSQLESLDGEVLAFEPQSFRLRLALAARAIEAPWILLEHQRRELAREEGELAVQEGRRPAVESAAREAEAQAVAAAETFRSASAAEAAARPLLQQVIGLDQRLAEARRQADALLSAIRRLDEGLAELETERLCLEASRSRSREEQDGVEAWLDGHRSDAGLDTALSGIRQALSGVVAAMARHGAAKKEFDEAGTALREAESSRTESLSSVDAVAEALRKAEDAHALIRGDLETQLEGRTVGLLREELDRSRQDAYRLDEIAKLYASGREFQPKLDELSALIDALTARQEVAGTHLQHEKELLKQAERSLDMVEENFRLTLLVRSYEEERRRLSDGRPCPLCGSTAHPWAEEGAALPSEEGDGKLAEARALVRRHTSKLHELELLIAGYVAEGAQLETRRKEQSDERERLGRRCLELLDAAGIKGPSREAAPEVEFRLEAAYDCVSSLERLLMSIGELEERLRQASDERQLRLDGHREARYLLEQADGRISAAGRELERAGQSGESALRELSERRDALRQLLAPFGFDALPEGSAIDTMLATLDGRAGAWRGMQERLSAIRQEVAGQAASLSGIAGRGDTVRSERAARQDELGLLEPQIEKLAAGRASLFGDLDPASEGERLSQASSLARDALGAAGESASLRRQELGGIDAAISDLNRVLADRRATVEKLGASFRDSALSRGFDDEQRFLAARLPEAEVLRLSATSEAFMSRRRELESMRKERLAALERERETGVDPRKREELREAVPAMQESLRNAIEEIGAIRRQLAENSRLVAEQQEQLAAVAIQAEECLRWDLLHDLIGSADGKKFRNFAQGLTFEAMVAHANRQLRLMTDRYLLVRDHAVPLELNVVDTWQAGEIRSTRNLSGGESFIVSLALALGLSHMSSRNVRVDSLFLDEGFGTLDDDALETALETLSGLQQSGKLIGVISHVPALKERISTRIIVTPLTGGRSAISGPGVARNA